MNKSVIMLMMGVGATLGGFLPYLLGDHEMLSVWPIVGSMIGGVIGVWLGAVMAKNI